jgi:hypothetical protein
MADIGNKTQITGSQVDNLNPGLVAILQENQLS